MDQLYRKISLQGCNVCVLTILCTVFRLLSNSTYITNYIKAFTLHPSPVWSRFVDKLISLWSANEYLGTLFAFTDLVLVNQNFSIYWAITITWNALSLGNTEAPQMRVHIYHITKSNMTTNYFKVYQIEETDKIIFSIIEPTKIKDVKMSCKQVT